MYNLQTIYQPETDLPKELQTPEELELRKTKAYERAVKELENLLFSECYTASWALHRVGDLLWLLPKTSDREEARAKLKAVYTAWEDLEKVVWKITGYDEE